MQKHKGKWLAYDIAAPDNDAVLPAYVSQQMEDSGRSAGPETSLSGQELSNIIGVEAIHVFLRRYCAEYLLLVNVFRERKLNENTVRPRAEPCDRRDDLFGRRRSRQPARARPNTDLGASAFLVADINRGSGVVADHNNGELCVRALQRSLHLSGDSFSVNNHSLSSSKTSRGMAISSSSVSSTAA